MITLNQLNFQIMMVHNIYVLMNSYIIKSQTDMKLKDQLIARFQQLERINQELSLALEKYRQETEYACLKTGTADWQTFLTAIRTGKIAVVSKEKPEGEGTAMALLNGLFENASTTRSTGRQPFCECESPICSEGSVRHAKGGDTSRSESAAEAEVLQAQEDPFNILKIDDLGSGREKMREESVEQILKYIEQYEQEKSNSLQGFDTFRKPQKDETLNQTAEHANSSQNRRNEFGSNRQSVAFDHTAKIQHGFKALWRNKENYPLEIREWKPTPSPNQYTLAMQNTKLRKQLRELEARFLQ